MRKKSYLFWNSLPLGNTHLEFEPLSSQRMGQTSTYLVDVPPTTYLVDVPPTTYLVDVPPTTYLVDVPPTTYLVDVPPTTYLVDVPPTTYLVDGLSKKIFFPFTLNGMAMATSASIISK
ncbi:hypothetical protein [Methanolobus sp. WCC5]|uniref:hypothetical protein n=1 Tax=Methanolobus sp. WCC5 TaxID=3125785 RepID=UPI00324A55E0